MVQKSSVIFEIVKGDNKDRAYQFIVPVGAPFGEVFDVVFELLSTAEGLSKQALDNAKKALDEAKSKEIESSAQEVVAELQ